MALRVIELSTEDFKLWDPAEYGLDFDGEKSDDCDKLEDVSDEYDSTDALE